MEKSSCLSEPMGVFSIFLIRWIKESLGPRPSQANLLRRYRRHQLNAFRKRVTSLLFGIIMMVRSIQPKASGHRLAWLYQRMKVYRGRMLKTLKLIRTVGIVTSRYILTMMTFCWVMVRAVSLD